MSLAAELRGAVCMADAYRQVILSKIVWYNDIILFGIMTEIDNKLKYKYILI